MRNAQTIIFLDALLALILVHWVIGVFLPE